MKLSETTQGDLIKFSKTSKVDWFVAVKTKKLIELWSSNDTTRTIRTTSKSWDKEIIVLK